MSGPGRQWLLEYARLELDIEFWTQWSDRLHPDEIRAILDKENPIDVVKRPLKPTWIVGEWMLIAPNFEIRPAKPRWVKNRYRITFSIKDYRSGGRTVQRQLREDPENVTTLQLLKDHAPGEPEKIPHGLVKDLRSSLEARQRHTRTMTEARLAHAELPVGIRLARMLQLAKDAHVDISGEERVILKRIEAIERKLLDKAA